MSTAVAPQGRCPADELRPMMCGRLCESVRGLDDRDGWRRSYWVLSGPTSSYALLVTDRDELLHLHWGPRIGLGRRRGARRPARCRTTGASSPRSTGTRSTRSRAAPASSAPPCPCARRAARHRVGLRAPTSAEDGDELRLGFADRPASRITLHYRMRDDADVIERWVTLAHAGAGRLELLRADSAAWTLPPRDAWRLSQLHGRWAAESRLVRPELTYGEKVIGSRRGHTGHQHLPWVALDTRRHRGARRGLRLRPRLVRVLAHRRGTSCPTARADHRRRRLRRLRPAAARTGRVVHLPRLRRAVERRRIRRREPRLARLAARPRHPGRRPGPAGALQLLGGHRASTSPRSSSAALAAPGRGRWASSCSSSTTRWFGQRTSDRAGLGDWTPNPDRFPRRAEAARRRGARAWACSSGSGSSRRWSTPDSDLYRAHPDWVQHHPGRNRTEFRNQLVLNLAREDVQEYLWERLDTLLSSAPDRLCEVGLQPLLHGRGLARRRLPAAAVGRPRPRALRPAGPAAGRAPRGRLRVLLGRRRPDRPRGSCPAPTRCGPPTTPTRWTGSPSSTASARSTRRG